MLPEEVLRAIRETDKQGRVIEGSVHHDRLFSLDITPCLPGTTFLSADPLGGSHADSNDCLFLLLARKIVLKYTCNFKVSEVC